ncbi:MAG: sulfotransferase, partial [Pseudomonadota bacterium]
MSDAIEHTNPDPSLETNRRPTIQHDGYEKVFGIGLPKTATTSLEQAFVNLGFRKIGYSSGDISDFLR